jgi:hypothetical protein
MADRAHSTRRDFLRALPSTLALCGIPALATGPAAAADVSQPDFVAGDRASIARRIHALATEMSMLLGDLDDAMWQVRVSPPFRGIANFSVQPAVINPPTKPSSSGRAMADAIEAHTVSVRDYEREVDLLEGIFNDLPPAHIVLARLRVRSEADGSETLTERRAARPIDIDQLAHTCCPGYGVDQVGRLPGWIAEKKTELRRVRRRRDAAVRRSGYQAQMDKTIAASNVEDAALATLLLHEPSSPAEASEKQRYLASIGVDERTLRVRDGVAELVFADLCRPTDRSMPAATFASGAEV